MTESFIELGESAQVQSKELSQTVWYASYLTSSKRSVTDEHYVLKWQRHWRLIPMLTHLEDLWRGAAHRLLRLNSDNGTNFVGVDRELRQSLESWNQ